MSRSLWATRRARAAHLLREAPHAEALLAFYIELTEIQEDVADRVPVAAWGAALRSDVGTSPALAVARLPPEELETFFHRFLRETSTVGTEVIRAEAETLLAEGPAERRAALVESFGFHARAFLEALLTTLGAVDPSTISSEQAPAGERCYRCGAPPVAGVLQDLPDALGSRALVCSLCAAEWRVDRLHCAHCGESSADKLHLHTAESVPWVRIDECLTCGCYLKTVDLRQRGDAVPVVDELATVELDLWARERGLKKVQVNVLQL